MPQKKNNQFLVCWCNEGLECIIPIRTEFEQFSDKLLAAFSGDTEPSYQKELSRTIWMLKIRANANSHRFYEIYYLTTSPEITEGFIRELFETSPQVIVDSIRERGQRIFGHGQGNDARIR